MRGIYAFFLIILANVEFAESISKPTWPKRIYAEGYLILPYAELSEPFTAWYDEANDRSRIDFYGGLAKTIQRGDTYKFGQHYMIAPMTTESVINVLTCFVLNGTEDAPVSAQHILPDVTKFEHVGEKQYIRYTVDVWQYKYNHGSKYNVYSLYINQKDGQPVYYEMMGYDSLLGSHYDEYKIMYTKFSDDFTDDVFDEMQGKQCQGFPGPGYEARQVANPMGEFVYPEDYSHLSPMYNDFVNNYKKKNSNSNPDILSQKQHTFKHNLRYINSMNRKNLSFKLKVNHFADHTPNELRRLRGRRTSVGGMNQKTNNGKPFVKSMANEDVPKEMNWRLRGAVTPVKDQAVCGSCWSFGTTGTIEGAIFLKTGRRVRLSQQNLMDCSWGYGNNACDGGEEFRAYEYIMKHGISTEASYGQYLGVDSYCRRDHAKVFTKLSGYVNVTSGDMDALKMAIYQHGPVAVGIDASHLSFVFYSHGIYYEPDCGNTPDDLDHAVLAVGYGEMNGEGYWLVKNSWSTHWGNDGYVLMSQKNNNCGVASSATFVTLE